MYYFKLFLYDNTQEANGYRGQDLSQYVLVGAQNTENITEELDESNITLHGYPVREEFAPETKFILVLTERDIESGEEYELEELHRVVEQDMVEQPIISDDSYFIHAISLLEPSVVAQKRICDNISVTYKLKDVNLRERKSITADMIEKTNVENTVADPPRGFGNYVDRTSFSATRNTSFGKHFVWKAPDESSQIRVKYISADDGSEKIEDYHYIDIDKIQKNGGRAFVQFILPAPHIFWGLIDGTDGNPAHRPPQLLSPAYADIGCASFSWRVVETVSGAETSVYTGIAKSNSHLGDNADTVFPFKWAVDESTTPITPYIPDEVKDYYLIEDEVVNRIGDIAFRFTQYSFPDGADIKTNFVLTPQIEIRKNAVYNISLQIARGDTPVPQNYRLGEMGTIVCTLYTNPDFIQFCYFKRKLRLAVYDKNIYDDALPIANTSPTATFQAYSSSDGVNQVLSSGIPYTALSLLKKAIINSDIYFKKSGVSVVDINNDDAEYPFYIDDGWAQTLSLTQVNENFYNQKNLWEIALEVGKYIHAIPELKFGKNDKFVFVFNPLGKTEKHVDAGTRSTVTNFRGVGDYIASCSSYVSNFVQLGGEITEKVAPKSTSEDFIVSNENAEIVVSKPIIELLKIEATCNSNRYTLYNINEGETRDITKFFYEKNVYQILSERYYDDPNKGIAMYYELGDKIIRGGDYRLPQKNTNAYKDYSFKKILYCGWHDYPTNIPLWQASYDWTDIRVNDFTFTVTYRTKDSARVEHTRPDLRHYLVSSKHDRYPVHRQFNNQQDILIDSDAFGMNMFGKLIRTGNSEYKVTEWCSSYSEVKHKGELYEIEGDLYYVAKVTHIFLTDHIESVVEYSKDYNQLSAVIGIPSEPRFYEISEQSAIDREVAINDLLLATTDLSKIGSGMISDIGHTADLIFGLGANFLKWAIMTIRGDFDNKEPSTFGVSDFSKRVMLPISAYASGNTLVYEWDTVDNFSAGDNVEKEVDLDHNSVDEAYRALRAVQYCDKYGKGTLLDFALRGEINLDAREIRMLPNYPTNRVACRMNAKATAFGASWLTQDNVAIVPEEGYVYTVGEIYNYDGTVLSYLFVPTNTALANAIQESQGRAPAAGDVVVAYRYGAGLDIHAVAFIYIYTFDGANWTSKTIYDWRNGNYYSDDQFLYFTWDSNTNAYVMHDPTQDIDDIYTDIVVANPQSIALLKDCRETLHFNYNLQAITDSDTFVITPPFFTPKNDGVTRSVAYKTVDIEAGSNVQWELSVDQEVLRLNPFNPNESVYATQNSGETLEKFNVYVYLDNKVYVYGDSSAELDNPTPFDLPSGTRTQIPFVKTINAVIPDAQKYSVKISGTQSVVVSDFTADPKVEIAVDPTYVALLRNEVNKLTNGYISQSDIVKVFPLSVDKQSGYFAIDLSEIRSISEADWADSKPKALAVLQTVRSNSSCRVIIAKNIPEGTTATAAGADWYFGAPNATLFTNRQQNS